MFCPRLLNHSSSFSSPIPPCAGHAPPFFPSPRPMGVVSTPRSCAVHSLLTPSAAPSHFPFPSVSFVRTGCAGFGSTIRCGAAHCGCGRGRGKHARRSCTGGRRGAVFVPQASVQAQRVTDAAQRHHYGGGSSSGRWAENGLAIARSLPFFIVCMYRGAQQRVGHALHSPSACSGCTGRKCCSGAHYRGGGTGGRWAENRLDIVTFPQ